ncbi:class I SAM-dependent methyltransferase [bacterium]|nr:class I SAM-dependent methyltransferase [bacterium]
MKNNIEDFIARSLTGKEDSDRHLMTIFSIALATRGKNYIELGVRGGTTTKPLLEAAKINGGNLFSVDIDAGPNIKDPNWHFNQVDAIEYLKMWRESGKPAPDFVYVDDWHSYDHVKKELEILDDIVTPNTVILLHDLMYGNTAPHYHSDMTMRDGQWANGGPYRAVAELNPQFWEFATLPWSHGLTILRKKYSNRSTTV